VDAIDRAVVAPRVEIVVHRAPRRQALDGARHWQPALKMYMIPLITSRTTTVRLLKPRLAQAGSMARHTPIRRQSGRSDIVIGCGRNVRVLRRPNRCPSSNESQLIQRIFNMFPDRHLDIPAMGAIEVTSCSTARIPSHSGTSIVPIKFSFSQRQEAGACSRGAMVRAR
jgi:hypothetical protein